MEHGEAEENNTAERYLKQELTPEEEISFEEHLLVCSECRDKIIKLEDIIETLGISQQKEFKNEKGRILNIRAAYRKGFKYLKIAAVVLIFAGISGLLLILFNEVWVRPKPVLITKNINDTAKKVEVENTAVNDIGKIAGNKAELHGVNGRNFEPDMFYEKLVEENYRNTTITILNPLKDTLTRVPAFEWEGQVPEILTLKIIDNRENTIYQKPLRNGSFPEIDIKPGLYYWQLMSEKETVATGKFIYLRSSGR